MIRLGYACINNSIDCTTNSTFRLASYSVERMKKTVASNLECFKRILKFNVENNILFFRLGSNLVPFASHSVCRFDWQKHFRKEFQEIGKYIRKHKLRITMHPDQFVLINALDKKIVEKSIKELEYHCDVLDLMGLGEDSKMTIHVGGVYGEKEKSISRFIENYKKLPVRIKKRIVIENDHLSYSLKDCLKINKKIGVPVVFDSFHHECLNNGESLKAAIKSASRTWKKKDGRFIMHYSSQKKDARKGSHSYSLNKNNFRKFLGQAKGIEIDLMLEIKNKEKSLFDARKILANEKFY